MIDNFPFPFKGLCKSLAIKRFSQQHFKTAIRLSAKLSAKEFATKEERTRVEHLIFVHLNAARRAFKLKKKKKK
jgi:hypothetical protein